VAGYKSGVVRNLRQIGEQLGVAHVLEGSVQRAANRIRVTAQLIDARNDSHLWAEHYDRALDDVFAIQSEITRTIADQLHAKLSPTEKSAVDIPPTKDLEAYDLYLRARALYADTSDPFHAQEKLPEAARLLDAAVARDPSFLLAWCQLANVHDLMYFQGHDHTPARLEQANKAVQAALRIQPNSGQAHLALAYHYYAGFRDYSRAREELAIARRTLPSSFFVPACSITVRAYGTKRPEIWSARLSLIREIFSTSRKWRSAISRNDVISMKRECGSARWALCRVIQIRESAKQKC